MSCALLPNLDFCCVLCPVLSVVLSQYLDYPNVIAYPLSTGLEWRLFICLLSTLEIRDLSFFPFPKYVFYLETKFTISRRSDEIQTTLKMLKRYSEVWKLNLPPHVQVSLHCHGAALP